MTRAEEIGTVGTYAAALEGAVHPLRTWRGVRATHVQLCTGRPPEANHFGLSWPGQVRRSQQMRRAVRSNPVPFFY
jgi:hypothetical protein